MTDKIMVYVYKIIEFLKRSFSIASSIEKDVEEIKDILKNKKDTK